MDLKQESRRRKTLSVTRAWQIGGMAQKEQEKCGWGNAALAQLAVRRFEGIGSAAILLQLVRLHDRWSIKQAQLADRIGVKLRDLPNLLAFDASPAERREMASNPAIRRRVSKRLKLQQQIFAEIKAGNLSGYRVRERVSELRKRHAYLWSSGSQKVLVLRAHRATRERIIAFIDTLRAAKRGVLRSAGKIGQDEKTVMGELMHEIDCKLESLLAMLALLDCQPDAAAKNS
ncbi:MAG: hypothetical protein HS116_05920 [Planctomycetes bacterium]|nr:hypothetical protein [Planctomycetota bacterium]